MHELGDITKWRMYLSKEEHEILPVLLASCSPSTLPQTLAARDWTPTALSKTARQWRGIRVGSSKHRLPLTVVDLIEMFIGKLDFMLRACPTSRCQQ